MSINGWRVTRHTRHRTIFHGGADEGIAVEKGDEDISREEG
jgi:hypothetical protein